MTPRVRMLVNGGVTVVILALVVFGLWAFTAPKSVSQTPPTITLSPAQASEKAYNDGLKALSAEQTDTAVAFFKKAIALDPSNSAAKNALSSANSAGSSSTKAPAKKQPKTVPASVWSKKYELKSLLPTAYPEYVLGHPEQGNASAADISGSPSNPSARVTSIVWTVHDETSASDAAKFVTAVSKKVYTKNTANVQVNDVTAYFGTNGADFATVVFTRGRYVFETIITSQSPASDQSVAVQAASDFPVAP